MTISLCHNKEGTTAEITKFFPKFMDFELRLLQNMKLIKYNQ